MTDLICHSQLPVAIPVYRSEAALPTPVQRLQPVLAALAGEYELVLMNDGGPDWSWEAIEPLAASMAGCAERWICRKTTAVTDRRCKGKTVLQRSRTNQIRA